MRVYSVDNLRLQILSVIAAKLGVSAPAVSVVLRGHEPPFEARVDARAARGRTYLGVDGPGLSGLLRSNWSALDAAERVLTAISYSHFLLSSRLLSLQKVFEALSGGLDRFRTR